MKRFELKLTEILQVGGGMMSLHLFRDDKDKKPLFWSMNVAASQFDEARNKMLAIGLRNIADQLEKQSAPPHSEGE